MELTLPTDLMYEVFSHVQDKPTIDNALKVAPDIVHKVVRRIYSPRVDEEPVSYLAAFPRLERAHVKEEDLDTLRPLSHLRSLCVEVEATSAECASRLEQIFRVKDRLDDQYYVFKIGDKVLNVCYHDRYCVPAKYYRRPRKYWLDWIGGTPRQYYDLLRSVRPYVDGNLGRILDIALKYRRPIIQAGLFKDIARYIDGKRLRDLVDLHMRDFITDAGYPHETDSVEALVSSGSTLASIAPLRYTRSSSVFLGRREIGHIPVPPDAMTLPPEILHHVFEYVQDKATIDSALEVVPDIVRDAVTCIHSPRVVQVSIDYLVAFKRLERTTNILVRVTQRRMRKLRALSHLRGLCVEVYDATKPYYCARRLKRIFRVLDKRDDQYFVFKVRSQDDVWNVCYHNGHCVTKHYALMSMGFTHDDISYLRPRPYFDLLQSALPLVDDKLRRALEVLLKYRRFVHIRHDRYLLDRITRQDLVSEDLPWHLLHYYDIPDRPMLYTREDAYTIISALYDD